MYNSCNPVLTSCSFKACEKTLQPIQKWHFWLSYETVSWRLCWNRLFLSTDMIRTHDFDYLLNHSRKVKSMVSTSGTKALTTGKSFWVTYGLWCCVNSCRLDNWLHCSLASNNDQLTFKKKDAFPFSSVISISGQHVIKYTIFQKAILTHFRAIHVTSIVHHCFLHLFSIFCKVEFL